MEITGDIKTVIKFCGIPIYSKTIITTTDFNPEEHIAKMKEEIATDLTAEVKKGLNIR